MAKVCGECHHVPSGRWSGDYGAECYCNCHDVADAAPALLIACRAAFEVLVAAGVICGELDQLKAAIAEAEKANSEDWPHPVTVRGIK
jgi:hypothetical protein